MSRKIAENGGREIVPSGSCDAVKGEDITFQNWTAMLLKKIASMPNASPLVVELSDRINDLDQIDTRRQIILESVTVRIFTSKEVKEAAANSFMSRQRSAVSTRRSYLSKRSTDSLHLARNSDGTLHSDVEVDEGDGVLGKITPSFPIAPCFNK